MAWQNQGRQYHEWFGHGTAPPKLKPIADTIAATDDSLGERLRSVAQGAVGALAKALRRQAEAQLLAGTLGRLTEAMTAWVRGSKMDAGGFASHFFGRAADDPVVATLRAAVSEASFATTQAQLAKASGDLAEAMKAVGLDSWPRFVADARARARDPATVAAIEKSLQPPDLKKDAITPVYPVEKALAVAAAAATGGAAGLVGAAARAVGGAVASKILGHNPAPAGTAPSSPPGSPKEVTPQKPGEVTKPPAAPQNDPSSASVLDKLFRYTLNPDHPEGGPKAKWFEQALGFTRANIEDLAKQIVFDPSKAV